MMCVVLCVSSGEAELRAAGAELWAASPPDPHSAWEEAQWSSWPESSTRWSHNSASPPGASCINAHGDEVHRN
jgi:hypothetical protein